MAESSLSLSYDNLMEEVAFYRGYGRKKDTTAGLSSAEETQCIADVNAGLRLFYFPPPAAPGEPSHEWSFMTPQTSIVAWATTTGTLSAGIVLTGVQSAVSYDSTTGYTTLTATAAIFTPELCGKTLDYTDATANLSYTIVEYVSTTQVKLSGDASGESGNFDILSVSKVTASAAAFETSMPGQTFTYDTSSNDYTVLSYVSSTVLYLDGDVVAASESGTDTYTITAYGVYRLPDDFGGIYGHMTFATGTGAYERLTIRSEGQLRHLLQDSNSTARPKCAAIRPVASSASLGQRFDLLVSPIPDSDYTLYYRYIILQDKLTQTNRYPLGGMAHAETVKAACLAAAEQSLKDVKGPKWELFMERLSQSVDYDQRANRAESLGYMSDNSDQLEGFRGPHGRRSNIVTFNNVAYP
jgi:hypothetical protein